MVDRFEKIDRLIAEWKTLQPIEADAQKKLDKKFRLEFNYNSNHLEGNTLTYGETELLLYFEETHLPHSIRELDEMRNHDAAWQMVEEWAKDKERPLTEQAIKNLNEIILVRPFWKEAITPDGQTTRKLIRIGDYKQHSNSVRLANGEIFEYASPVDTPVLMQELIEWHRTEQLHPVALAAMLHYKFVRIHPFDDGNGRIARLLMNYVLLQNDLPPVIIKSADKQFYLRVLRIADTGNFEPFIDYVAEQLEWSLEISIKAAKGESIEEEDDVYKELSVWKKKILSETQPLQKSIKFIIELYENSLSPFFDLCIAEMQTHYSDLFDKVEIKGFVNETIFTNPEGKKFIDGYIFKLKNSVSADNEDSLLKELRSLNVRIELSQPRFNTIRHRYDYRLSVLFLDSFYKIQINGENLFEKKYHQFLSLDEQDSLKNKIIKKAFLEMNRK